MGKNISKVEKSKNASKISNSKDKSETKKIKSVIYTPLPKDRPPTEEELKQRKANALSNMICIISLLLIYFMIKMSGK
ncbi:hypothetical protein SAMN02745163_04210 [Clostridium cavendishii DSM 21758]|uniref:Uncharacterized protein n=1 Tax=Clostridium cavendishii DSM 21758 TaxID=1121302 RepID=A0A1M6U8N4_9CLOT|nr:hypothetical protein [Clostridium cavendishii]SHK65438.1 hypothetical protein SAMN02745163_04210 [Clostridium cavendishii DSM 21758]